ncbi:MAG TPA: glycosyltransferase, partial [Terriglobales bacterium]|nr:glycosyltransferase [Terriglobales bacterium]
MNLLAALQRSGHELLAVTSTWTDGEFSKRLANMGIEEKALPLGTISVKRILWTLDSLVHAPKLWFGWRRTIRSFRPDILLLTNPKQGLWLYPWLARQRSFLVEHGMKSPSGANRWMYQKLQKKLSGFIAVSNFMARHLQSLGVDSRMVHVIYNCCSLPSTEQSDQSSAARGTTLRIGIAGQISAHKGHELLIDAA